MVRRFLVITGLLLLPGCGGPPQPTLQPDADTVTAAVAHAQAQVDGPAHGEESE
jgi:hypothetical protein